MDKTNKSFWSQIPRIPKIKLKKDGNAYLYLGIEGRPFEVDDRYKPYSQQEQICEAIYSAAPEIRPKLNDEQCQTVRAWIGSLAESIVEYDTLKTREEAQLAHKVFLDRAEPVIKLFNGIYEGCEPTSLIKEESTKTIFDNSRQNML